jgi:hypothetical protein
LLTAKFNDARLLRALFLLFHNGLPRFLLFFGPRNIDRSLRCDFQYEDHTAKTEQDPVPHLRLLTKTNQILQHPAIIAADADVAN